MTLPTLEKGKEYVFSAYIKTDDEIAHNSDGGLRLCVTYKDSTGTEQNIESRRAVHEDGDWEYIQVVFTLPENAASDSVRFACVHRGFRGTSYFDCIQLEEGNIGGRRNLIENNDFTYEMNKFTKTGTNESVDKLMNTDYLPMVEFPQLLIGVVNADSLYVRSGPGSNYSAVTSVVNGDMVTILEAHQGTDRIWYKIGFGVNGVRYIGYVATEYITVVTNDGIRTGYVNADLLNVRSGAGTGYGVVVQLPTNSIVTILGSVTAGGINWYHINTDYQDVHYSGYVSSEYIIEITAQDPSELIDNKEEVYTNPGALDSTVLHMVGDPLVDKRVSQTLNISGSMGDVYVISGWGLANSLPIRGNRAFGVELEFTYTDGTTEAFLAAFSGDSNQWQFANRVVIANKAYSSVKASYVYAYNANKAYFDGLSVYKDEYWPSFTYDENGNVVTCSDAKNQKATFAYDANNNLTNFVTPEGSSFEYTYDVLGRLQTISKPNNVNGTEVIVTQTYSYENDRIKTINRNGMNYSFVYDEFGNVVQIFAGNQLLFTHTYIMNGRLLERTVYPNGEGKKYEYDEFDRLIKEYMLTGGLEIPTCEYIYDNEGNLSYIIDGNEETHFEYTLSGDVAFVQLPSNELFKYVYDKNHCLTNVELKDFFRFKQYGLSYEYNADNQEIEMQTTNGKIITSVYDTFGRLGSKTIATTSGAVGRSYNETLATTGAFITTYSYCEPAEEVFTNLIETINHNGRQMTYEYYDDGNIKQVTTFEGTVTYEYDNLGQLIRVNDSIASKTYVYTYDTGFNMTSETRYAYTDAAVITGVPEKQRLFTYDSVWKDKLITCDGKTLTYDDAGNLKTYDGVTLSWTTGRKINSFSKGGTAASYSYNAEGLRASKIVGADKTTYTYSGGLLIREESPEHTLFFSYDSLGNPVAVMYNYGEYYYMKNLQGDIVGLVDTTGTWVVEYSYDVWGNILSTTGTMADTLGQANPLRYRGYYYDNETGFYYLGSRYYCPEIGRFICPDGTTLLDVEQMKLTCKNLYVYCDNNPVSKTDIQGEIAWAAVAAVAVGAGLNVLSSWIVAEAEGKEFTSGDAFVSALTGAIGAAGAFGVAYKTAGIVTSIVLDSVYAAATDGIEAGATSALLSVFGVSGVFSITGIGENLDDGLSLLLEFGGDTFMDIAANQKEVQNTSSNKSSASTGNTKTTNTKATNPTTTKTSDSCIMYVKTVKPKKYNTVESILMRFFADPLKAFR